jgi:hypothetical protein
VKTETRYSSGPCYSCLIVLTQGAETLYEHRCQCKRRVNISGSLVCGRHSVSVNATRSIHPPLQAERVLYSRCSKPPPRNSAVMMMMMKVRGRLLLGRCSLGRRRRRNARDITVVWSVAGSRTGSRGNHARIPRTTTRVATHAAAEIDRRS